MNGGHRRHCLQRHGSRRHHLEHHGNASSTDADGQPRPLPMTRWNFDNAVPRTAARPASSRHSRMANKIRRTPTPYNIKSQDRDIHERRGRGVQPRSARQRHPGRSVSKPVDGRRLHLVCRDSREPRHHGLQVHHRH